MFDLFKEILWASQYGNFKSIRNKLEKHELDGSNTPAFDVLFTRQKTHECDRQITDAIESVTWPAIKVSGVVVFRYCSLIESLRV